MPGGDPRCMRELRVLCDNKEYGRKLELCRRTRIIESLGLEENLSGHLVQPLAQSWVDIKFRRGCLGHCLAES